MCSSDLDAGEYFDDLPNVKVAPDMLKLAEHILEGKEADFDPSHFVDHYEEAVVEMLKQKQAGIKPPKGKAAEPPRNVINLFDALKKSIAADKGQAAGQAKAAPAKRGKKRIEGQREMLLPISGKKGKEAAAAKASTGKAPARAAGTRQRKAG